jgi:hypothetical protein
MRGFTGLTLVALIGLGGGCAFHSAEGADGGRTGGGTPTTSVDGATGDLISGGTGNGDGGPNADANCGASMYGLEMLPPDMLIVLDKSGSMNDDTSNMSCANVANCMSKWSQMTPAINQVVGQTDGMVRWGLKYYPSGSGSNNSCTVNNNPEVPVGDNVGAAVMSSIAMTTPGGRTPTSTAVNTGATYLAGLGDPNPKYILLATDGLPNCAPGQNSANDDTAGAVAAVTAAKNMGIGVFVVGISTNGTDADGTLNMLAQAGGYPLPGTPSYYSVASTAELVSALSMIATQIASGCTFPLGKVPPAPDNIGIYADGNKLPRDTNHTNGWDYNAGMTSVTIYGPTCDALMAGTIKMVQAFLGCGVDPIP